MHCRGTDYKTIEEALAAQKVLKQQWKEALANPAHHAIALDKLAASLKRMSSCDTTKEDAAASGHQPPDPASGVPLLLFHGHAPVLQRVRSAFAVSSHYDSKPAGIHATHSCACGKVAGRSAATTKLQHASICSDHYNFPVCSRSSTLRIRQAVAEAFNTKNCTYAHCTARCELVLLFVCRRHPRI
jgi:hypothetical protein